MPVRADAVSAQIRALDEALADRFEAYRAHLEAAPLAAHTRRTYAGRVAGYLSWRGPTDPLAARHRLLRGGGAGGVSESWEDGPQVLECCVARDLKVTGSVVRAKPAGEQADRGLERAAEGGGRVADG